MLKNKKIVFLTLVAISLAIFSCDKDKKYDVTKAVLAFSKQDLLRIDKNLDNFPIILPPQELVKNWPSSSLQSNDNFQNIAKTFAINKNGEIEFKKSTKYWSFYRGSFDKKFIFSPVIFNDKSYNLDSTGVLRAFDLKEEKLIFKKRIFPRQLTKNYQTPKITYFNDMIFAIAGVNKIACVNAQNGKIIWQKNISSIPVSSPLADKDKIYVITNDNKVYALSQADGSLQWVQSGVFRPTAIFGSAELVIKDNIILASYSSGEIYALNKDSGNVIWSNRLNISKATDSDFYLNDIDSTPVVVNDIVYTVGNGGLMMAINIFDGNYLWKREIASIADFWVSGNYIFVINNDNRLLAIHKDDGKIKWITNLPHYKNPKKVITKYIYNGLVVAGDKIIISSLDGDITIVSPINGKILKKINIAKKLHHSPIIVGDKMYFYVMDKLLTRLIEIQ